MGVLSRWDQRQQRAIKRENEVDETVEPGIVAFFSIPALLKIGVLAIGVAVVGVASGEISGFVIAAVAIAIGGVLCFNLAKDARSDLRSRPALREGS